MISDRQSRKFSDSYTHTHTYIIKEKKSLEKLIFFSGFSSVFNLKQKFFCFFCASTIRTILLFSFSILCQSIASANHPWYIHWTNKRFKLLIKITRTKIYIKIVQSSPSDNVQPNNNNNITWKAVENKKKQQNQQQL